MPSRSHQRDLSWMPSRLMLVKTPFLLVRFVVFSLLIYMSLTALVFAAWNVGASRAAGARVDGSALVIFTGSATPLCIAVCVSRRTTGSLVADRLFLHRALADAKIVSFSTSMVGFECAWTGIFTVLQIAASIFVTLSGPPEFCVANAPFSVCASITILVPISWLAASLLLGYFVTILALFVAHSRVHEALWSTSIYDVVWFDDDYPHAANRRAAAPQIPPSTPSAPLCPSRRGATRPPRSLETYPNHTTWKANFR
ncbi:hypothetical protein BJV78DRAFT_915369 [Lactifluus subvellereus]|nr:hypothetical protein BJV78DRAFT_915369 [Lactifluus subvellereus]